MSSQALISIIIPTFNRAHLIGETLDSVLAQDYKNWECIVVDDGSTDDTKSLVDSYGSRDNRIKYFKRSGHHLSGGNGARNYGFKESKGDYLVFLDSDDLLMPFAISQRMANINSTLVDMLVTESGVFKEEIGDTNMVWNTISNADSNDDFLIRFFNADMPWQTTGVTWARKFFLKNGIWNEGLTAWQDWELHCRALLSNPNITVASGPVDNYYRHLTSDGIANSYKSRRYLKAMEKAILSVYHILIKNETIFDRLKPYYIIFIFYMLIKRPIAFGYKWFSLRYLFMIPFFKDMSRFKFLKIYAVELLGRSTKIRTFLLGSLYKKQQIYLQMRSNHLK